MFTELYVSVWWSKKALILVWRLYSCMRESLLIETLVIIEEVNIHICINFMLRWMCVNYSNMEISRSRCCFNVYIPRIFNFKMQMFMIWFGVVVLYYPTVWFCNLRKLQKELLADSRNTTFFYFPHLDYPVHNWYIWLLWNVSACHVLYACCN